MFKLILSTMRPSDWIKNLFVFAPLLFSQNLLNVRLFLYALSASLIFCLASGSIYIINDIKDRDEDRSHPTKAHRPIASQSLSVKNATVAAFALHVVCLTFSWFICPVFMIIVISYLLLHILYSCFLKKVVVLDVMVIAVGFIFRVLAGSAAIRVQTSHWLILCTAQIALFLALAKRRQEAIVQGDHFKETGRNSFSYKPYFIDQMISVVITSTLMSYALYTVSDKTIANLGTMNLIYTIPFVVYGMFRYLYLIHEKKDTADSTRIIIKDRPMILNLILWLSVVILTLYT